MIIDTYITSVAYYVDFANPCKLDWSSIMRLVKSHSNLNSIKVHDPLFGSSLYGVYKILFLRPFLDHLTKETVNTVILNGNKKFRLHAVRDTCI